MQDFSHMSGPDKILLYNWILVQTLDRILSCNHFSQCIVINPHDQREVQNPTPEIQSPNMTKLPRVLLVDHAPNESMVEYNHRLDSDIEYLCMLGNEQGLSKSEINHKHKIRHLMISYLDFSQSSQQHQYM